MCIFGLNKSVTRLNNLVSSIDFQFVIFLLQKNKENRQNQAREGGEVVPLEAFALEKEHHDGRKNGERDDLLDDLELEQRVGSAVAREADPVGRHGEAILEESDAPGEENHGDQRPARGDLHLLEFEVAVPREGHEDVGADQHHDCPESLHNCRYIFRAAKVILFF